MGFPSSVAPQVAVETGGYCPIDRPTSQCRCFRDHLMTDDMGAVLLKKHKDKNKDHG